MLGLMQEQPLLISLLLEHARRHHGDAAVVSRSSTGEIHRCTWSDIADRASRVAHALDELGVARAARVATLAWNGYRHLELYFGVSGSGRVLHTLNPRMHPEQIAWVINHAQDEVLCVELNFLPLVQTLKAACPTIRHLVVLCGPAELPPQAGLMQATSYETWLGSRPPRYDWPVLEENAASSMCYTSGTTGDPKAALYSHRSTLLHAFAAALPDSMALSARDSVLPVVPMFHVNAWGIPYAAALVGCKLVLPGALLDGRSIHELMEAEQVTFAAGVPTVWQMLLGHMKAQGLRFTSLTRTLIGGSACPPAMIDTFEREFGVEVRHGWGMTEMSPLGAICSLKSKHAGMPSAAQAHIRQKQGRALFGMDLRIVDERGVELPWNGVASGHLQVRGPWVIRQYYQRETESILVDGWFPTGDVATIDPDGYMQITDRSKDLIKSGGEWISSIDIENTAMAHPAVAMAACIGVPHPKWDERPIVVVVRRQGHELTREELLAFLSGKLAKWQVPDDVVFFDSIPLGATGKMLKTRVREMIATRASAPSPTAS